MGIRIHRTMGWGMRFEEFNKTSTLIGDPDYDHCKLEALDNVLSAASFADFVVPKDIASETYKRPGSPIWNPRLLDAPGKSRKLARTTDRRPYRDALRPTQLYSAVMDCDETHAIIFYPNGHFARRWNRYDDDMDYAFEQYRDGDNSSDPRDLIQEMKFAPYPYVNSLMDPRTGEHLPWTHYFMLDETYPDGWAPAIPPELLWWTQKFGIFDKTGVLKLRPMLAQYWC